MSDLELCWMQFFDLAGWDWVYRPPCDAAEYRVRPDFRVTFECRSCSAEHVLDAYVLNVRRFEDFGISMADLATRRRARRAVGPNGRIHALFGADPLTTYWEMSAHVSDCVAAHVRAWKRLWRIAQNGGR